MIDNRVKAKLIEALKRGSNVAAAAREAGVARTDVYKLARADQAVDDALAAAQQRGGKGRRRPKACEPASVAPDASEAPAEPAGSPAPGMRVEALATLRAIHLDTTAATRDRVAAARGLLSAVPVAAAPILSAGPGGAEPADPAAAARAEAWANARTFIREHKGGVSA